MNDRRSFLTGAGSLAVGVTAAAGPVGSAPASASASAATGTTAAMTAPSQSPSARFPDRGSLPRNLTLLSIHQSDGAETLGIKLGDRVLDVRAAAQRQGVAAPLTVEALLREGGSARLNELASQARAGALDADLHAESGLRHGRLFTNPGKIVCVGLNYKQHAREVKMAEPRVPPLFNKFNNALAAHESTIALPPRDVAYKFDYETELLIVIGRAARNVSETQALDHVAGYCTANDFSARDLQLETPSVQWMIGKTLDGFAPIGPYFVSADVVGDPNALKIETRVNGELRQSWNTNDFIFNT